MFNIKLKLNYFVILGAQGLNCMKCGTLSEDPLSIEDCIPENSQSVRKSIIYFF